MLDLSIANSMFSGYFLPLRSSVGADLRVCPCSEYVEMVIENDMLIVSTISVGDVL